MSAFFRNVDSRPSCSGGAFEPDIAFQIDPGSGSRVCALAALRARALLIDTEEGVLTQLRKSSLGELFPSSSIVSDVSGAGNNWAHGFAVHGPRHDSRLHDALQRALEQCESPQGFMQLHSLGGGTGSGLGSYLVQACADWYPRLHRMSCPIIPSATDDVVTSPYNAVLALNQLHEHADAVFPMENGALQAIVQRWGALPEASPSAPSRCTATAAQAHPAPHTPHDFRERPRTGSKQAAAANSAQQRQAAASSRLSSGGGVHSRTTSARQRTKQRMGLSSVPTTRQSGARRQKAAAFNGATPAPTVTSSTQHQTYPPAAVQLADHHQARFREPAPPRNSQPVDVAHTHTTHTRDKSAFDSMNALGAALVIAALCATAAALTRSQRACTGVKLDRPRALPWAVKRRLERNGNQPCAIPQPSSHQ
jgi:tubulin epsilon